MSAFIRRLEKASRLPDEALARAAAMPPSTLKRLAAIRTGSVSARRLRPLVRVASVVEEARAALPEQAVRAWLTTPNPYLHDLPPIECVRSEEGYQIILAMLAALKRH